MAQIALVAGSWSSNVGNAFFNLGAEWLLSSLGHQVSFFPESPRWKENVDNSYDPVGDLDVDLVVLAGPCLWRRLVYVYESTFEKLYSRGVKVGYLTGGMAEYTAQEADVVAQFFKRFPPAFVSTRDQACYDLLAPLANCPIYSGLCTSMFLNDALTPVRLTRKPYCVYNFDDEEPELQCEPDGRMLMVKKKVKRPPLEVNGLEIVRPINLSIDVGYKKIYNRPNAYHSDLPQGYCSILAQAEVVYSERVHTCATALIYGGKAQFMTLSPRSHEKRKLLFDRIGASGVFERPTSLNMEYVIQEKAQMRQFLETTLNSQTR